MRCARKTQRKAPVAMQTRSALAAFIPVTIRAFAIRAIMAPAWQISAVIYVRMGLTGTFGTLASTVPTSITKPKSRRL